MVTGTKDAKVSDRPLEMPNGDNVLMEWLIIGMEMMMLRMIPSHNDVVEYRIAVNVHNNMQASILLVPI